MKLRPGIALKISLATCIALLPALPAAAADEPAPQHLTGAAAALDGGSLIWRQDGRIIRLYGLAAPPLWANGSLAPAGQAARQHLQGLVEGKTVTCRLLPDGGRQPRGQCQVDGGSDLVVDLLLAGHGLVDRLQTQQQDFGAELGRAYDEAEARAAANRDSLEPLWPWLKRWETLMGNLFGALLAGAAAGLAAWLTIRATREAATAQILAERHNRALNEIEAVCEALQHQVDVCENRHNKINTNLVNLEEKFESGIRYIKQTMISDCDEFSRFIAARRNRSSWPKHGDDSERERWRRADSQANSFGTCRLEIIPTIPPSASLAAFSAGTVHVKIAEPMLLTLREAHKAVNGLNSDNKGKLVSFEDSEEMIQRYQEAQAVCLQHLTNMNMCHAHYQNEANKYRKWFADHGEIQRSDLQARLAGKEG